MNCKTVPKEETSLSADSNDSQLVDFTQTPAQMWEDFTRAFPEYSKVPMPESDFFHNNREDADRLAELTWAGKKQASSGLYSLYKKYEAELPLIGAQQIVTDFDGNAAAIIENVSVDILAFDKVASKYAAKDMGTNSDALKKWREAHWWFFEAALKENHEKPTPNMLVVAVTFKKICPQE